GSWDPFTDFDSPMKFDPKSPNPGLDPTWSVQGTIDYYLSLGVSPWKLNVGIPYYAKQNIRTGTKEGGLYSAYDNTGLDANSLQWDQTPTPTFRDLVEIAGIITADGTVTASGAAAGWTTRRNAATGEPYLFNPHAVHALASGTITAPTFITYEDTKAVADRANYINRVGLRGGFAWEISQDTNAGALSGKLADILLH
ncbi:MAG: putative secreted protein, partial [Mycobacterium sp.]|nr:putative secreted protein [Mycobacterium sp.]